MTFLRLAAVIVLWFAALLFWDLGSLRAAALFTLAGAARCIAGAAFVFAALWTLYVSFPGLSERELSYFAIGSFLVALIADFIAGEDIRGLVRRR